MFVWQYHNHMIPADLSNKFGSVTNHLYNDAFIAGLSLFDNNKDGYPSTRFDDMVECEDRLLAVYELIVGVVTELLPTTNLGAVTSSFRLPPNFRLQKKDFYS